MLNQEAPKTLETLLEIMALLRHPDKGCVWDLEQNAKSLIHYTIEEAYEVADAIDRGDRKDLCNELGDLLLQVVFYAQIAKDEGAFDFHDVVDAITTKIIHRNQNIFGSKDIKSSEEQLQQWEEIKAKERAKGNHESILDDIPKYFPALLRGYKLVKRLDEEKVVTFYETFILDKIAEEVKEIFEAETLSEKEEEFGDLLLTLCHAAYHAGVDPEEALRKANYKLSRRVTEAEKLCKLSQREFKHLTEEDFLSLWHQVKAQEKSNNI